VKDEKHIRDEMKKAYGLESRDKDGFWSEFQRRAPSRDQALQGSLLPYPGRMQWAVAMALMMALLGGVFLMGRSGEAIAAPVVESLEVLGAYDSVFVIEDNENQSTIVWVVAHDA
jgi:hypothetical protein